MKPEENESDILKLPQEPDPEWVNLWDDCKNKKEPNTKQLTFDVIDI